MKPRGWRPFLLTQTAVFYLLAIASCLGSSRIVDLPASASAEDIQTALDRAPDGGRVRLGPGTFYIRQPIFLRKGGEALQGAGASTVLFLVDNANCPVIVLGAPLARPARPTAHLELSDLVIDGNRERQQAEFWQSAVDGSALMNNGIDVWNATDASISHVVCRRCRSGGLVTAAGTRRLVVSDFTACGNEFDGLACYQTEDSRFTNLFLHDNLGAGISLDLAFNHNRIEHAELDGNDLGVFMRHSRGNTFQNVRIRDSRHHGVFIAQALGNTAAGWQLVPGTECTDNSFAGLDVAHCGGRAVLINDVSCRNNPISDFHFADNATDPGARPLVKLATLPLPATTPNQQAEARVSLSGKEQNSGRKTPAAVLPLVPGSAPAGSGTASL